MVQIGSMPALQRARKDARVDPESIVKRAKAPGSIVLAVWHGECGLNRIVVIRATRRRSEGWCRAAAAPSLLAGERGEHAEHAEACKPGEGTARLPTDFARILFTLPARGFAHKAPPRESFLCKI